MVFNAYRIDPEPTILLPQEKKGFPQNPPRAIAELEKADNTMLVRPMGKVKMGRSESISLPLRSVIN